MFKINCKIGTFVFDEGTPLSLAKLVTSSVMGQMLAPQPGEKKITTEQHALDFIRSCDSAVLARVGFDVTFK